MKYQIVILFLVTFISCDSTDSKFKVVNQSNKTVGVYLDQDSSRIKSSEYFSDFFFIDPDGIRRPRQYDFVRAEDSGSFEILGEWDSDDNYMFDTAGNLYIFIIDSVDIGKNFAKSNLESPIRRFHTTKTQMQKNNWIIEVK